jgi:hypothetical protein
MEISSTGFQQQQQKISSKNWEIQLTLMPPKVLLAIKPSCPILAKEVHLLLRLAARVDDRPFDCSLFLLVTMQLKI